MSDNISNYSFVLWAPNTNHEKNNTEQNITATINNKSTINDT